MGRKKIELAGLRVLVADSQWLLAHETVSQLHREGVEVEGPVATVQAAIDIVRRGPLDAAIVEALRQRLEHPAELVREHVRWALAQHRPSGSGIA